MNFCKKIEILLQTLVHMFWNLNAVANELRLALESGDFRKPNWLIETLFWLRQKFDLISGFRFPTFFPFPLKNLN